MKKNLILAVFLALSVTAFSQTNTNSIIPQPAVMRPGAGSFLINQGVAIVVAPNQPELQKIANMLNAELNKATGFTLNIENSPRKNGIHFILSSEETLGNEGYRLAVTPEGISIIAPKTAGLFYGLQTLLQLMPKEIESKKVVQHISWTVPSVQITDRPRFGWRGLMLDVSRHFFTVDEVKAFIDDMARYKYNLMHFHLTDDQGWRLEIKSLPKLTEVGAWNVKKTGRFNYFTPPADNEPRDFGGFYTQEQMKELIRYAKDRYIDIMPEIDVPGHSLAAIASYPDLACTPGTYKVNSGEPIMDWHDNGTFTALIDNTLCPANEKVYGFLDKVFTEVAALFPFEYIHMGGDECAKNFWEKSAEVKSLMQREKLKDMHEVQSYFVGRVSKIIATKGKKMMGWDEILEGGLVKDASVMSWRGLKGGIEAAQKGHEVVMTPNSHVYIDLMQGDAAIEPIVYSSLRLKKTYEFEPLPEGVDPKLIKGGQANLWTEQIYNTRHMQYMLWPRAMAVAEAVWSPKQTRNWNNFIGRVEDHFGRFQQADRKYAPSMYDPAVKVSKDAKGSLLLDFETEIEGLIVHYSFDNSFPDDHYPAYGRTSVPVPVDAAPLKVVTYRAGKQVGRMMTISVDELRKRVK